MIIDRSDSLDDKSGQRACEKCCWEELQRESLRTWRCCALPIAVVPISLREISESQRPRISDHIMRISDQVFRISDYGSTTTHQWLQPIFKNYLLHFFSFLLPKHCGHTEGFLRTVFRRGVLNRDVRIRLRQFFLSISAQKDLVNCPCACRLRWLLIYLSNYLSIFLAIKLSSYLPSYLCTYLPTYLPIYLSIYLSLFS